MRDNCHLRFGLWASWHVSACGAALPSGVAFDVSLFSSLMAGRGVTEPGAYAQRWEIIAMRRLDFEWGGMCKPRTQWLSWRPRRVGSHLLWVHLAPWWWEEGHRTRCVRSVMRDNCHATFGLWASRHARATNAMAVLAASLSRVTFDANPLSSMIAGRQMTTVACLIY